MRRLLVGITVPALCALLTAVPARADSTDPSDPSDPAAPTGTSFASAANVVPGSGLRTSLTTNGDLSGLLDFLSPVVDQFSQPLADAINTMSTTMVADITDDIGQSSTATASTSAVATPDDYPSCDGAWSAGNCYHQTPVAANDNPIIAMRIGAADGWAASDSDGSAAGARSTGITLSALGVAVASIGSVSSTTSCTSGHDCTNTASFGDVSLLGGAALVKSASDGTPLVSFDSGDTWTALGDLTSTQVNGNGHDATVQRSGDSLELSVAITLDQLLTAVGQTDDLTDLGAYDDGSVVTLDVFVGGQDSGQSNDRGPGLRLGIGIGADIKTSVFGLVGSEVTVDDSDGGNAADIALAFTAAAGTSAGDAIGDPASLK